MPFNIAEDKKTLSQMAAQYFIRAADQAIAIDGRFSVCMSGGSTPKAMFELLAKSPYRDQVDWAKVYVFWGDERHVPLDHPDSNYLMTHEALLKHVPIPAHQIFPIQGGLPAEEAAGQYEAKLAVFFGHQPWSFDLIWLGMGDDGHTASLFPNTSVLEDDTVGVRSVWVPQHDTYRITFTAPLIMKARAIAFLISGADKAEALKAVLEGSLQASQFPSQLILRAGRNIDVFADRAAIAHLENQALD